MPYINVDEAYILDNTGVQVDNAVDYALYNSNRNLLDNWYFPTAVNQRGFTSGSTSNTYSVDRWKIASNHTITYSSGVISIPQNAVFAQDLPADFYAELVGKTVTLSVMLADGTIQSGSVTVPSSGGVYAPNTPRLGMNGGSHRFYIYPNTNLSVKAFKLELGSYSTLANDVPPDYGEELRKCRRYFRRYAPNQTGLALIGRAGSATEADFILGDEPMAKSTGITATIGGAVYARAGDNTNHSVTSATVQTSIGGGPALICTTTGLTAYATAVIVFASGGYIDILGDL